MNESIIHEFTIIASHDTLINWIKYSISRPEINFFLLRLFIPKYVHQYKKITLEEMGKVGRFYYWWVGSINLAWILAVVKFSS